MSKTRKINVKEECVDRNQCIWNYITHPMYFFIYGWQRKCATISILMKPSENRITEILATLRVKFDQVGNVQKFCTRRNRNKYSWDLTRWKLISTSVSSVRRYIWNKTPSNELFNIFNFRCFLLHCVVQEIIRLITLTVDRGTFIKFRD